MSEGHTARPDIDEIISHEFDIRRKQIKKVDFAWFKSRFHFLYKKDNQKPPSDSKIHRFITKERISVQRVRDGKTKTVEQRLEEMKD